MYVLFMLRTRFRVNPHSVVLYSSNSYSIECGLILKRVRDMTTTYSQMHRTDNYSKHSSKASLAKWLSVPL